MINTKSKRHRWITSYSIIVILKVFIYIMIKTTYAIPLNLTGWNSLNLHLPRKKKKKSVMVQRGVSVCVIPQMILHNRISKNITFYFSYNSKVTV